MKNKTNKLVMGKMLAFFVIGLMFCMTGCVGDDYERIDYPANAFDNEGAVTTISNVVGGFFNLVEKETTAISADLGTKGEDVSSIEVYKSFNDGPRELFKNVSPGTFSVSLVEAIVGTGTTLEDVAIGDKFTFTFDNVTSSGTFKSGEALTIVATCPSDLGGTYDYVSTNLVAANSPTACPSDEITGTVTFTDQGGGSYLISDLGFGQYESSCWNDGPATSGNAVITDVCGKITSGGLDQYGLTYVWVITDVSGPNLSISWSNDYADSGKTVLTTQDGSDWPPIFTQ